MTMQLGRWSHIARNLRAVAKVDIVLIQTDTHLLYTTQSQLIQHTNIKSSRVTYNNVIKAIKKYLTREDSSVMIEDP